MYRLIFIISLICISEVLCSQSGGHHCETPQNLLRELSNDPSLLLNFKKVQNQINEARDQAWLQERADFVIPIVFHIVLNKEDGNVTNEKIYNQIDALNDAYLGKNDNVQFLPDVFKVSQGSPEIAFCLATKDPDGNPHSGINRTATNINFIGDAENLEGKPRIKYSEFGGIDAWDTKRFINIWVGSKELGSAEATFPGGSIEIEQGIVIDPTFLTDDDILPEDPNYAKGHVLVHEMGHYFNLQHLFGGSQSCDSDDGIEDTPSQGIRYSQCPPHPQISCNSADMITNFMALTNDHCTRFFTKGQVEMIQATLNTTRQDLKNASCELQGDPISLEEKVEVKFLLSQDLVELDLDINRNDVIDISLYDMMGRLYFHEEISFRFHYNIDISELSSGIYILSIEDQEDQIVRQFFKL